jgi:hypothetical protein
LIERAARAVDELRDREEERITLGGLGTAMYELASTSAAGARAIGSRGSPSPSMRLPLGRGGQEPRGCFRADRMGMRLAGLESGPPGTSSSDHFGTQVRLGHQQGGVASAS